LRAAHDFERELDSALRASSYKKPRERERKKKRGKRNRNVVNCSFQEFARVRKSDHRARAAVMSSH